MDNLFQTLEDVAARGAAGLASEARQSVAAALLALRCPDGGFAGLDGRADPYYALFAWLSLRALGVAYDRGRLCAYMAAHLHDVNTVDARCAALVLACEGQRRRGSWLKGLVTLLRGDAHAVYGLFLLALATGDVPRWIARLAWRRQRKRFEDGLAERLPTPRLAAGMALASLAGERGADLVPVLESRRCAGGGFASAGGAQADLLATAVARFACAFGSTESLPPSAANERWRASVPASRMREDIAFIEACWLDDGLFGASPLAVAGDAEHTFYGLLALGTCRPGHS